MGILDSLPTLTDLQRTRRAVPKGAMRTQLAAALASMRDTRKAAAAFRTAVWTRDASRCQQCGRRCRRTLTLCAEQGHVHHLRGRRVRPEDQYNPDAAVLLCAVCHQQQHTGAR